MHAWNAGHGDAERDAVMVRCTRAFEFLCVFSQVLRELGLSPGVNLGGQVMTGMSQPSGCLAVEVRLVADDVYPVREVVVDDGHLESFGQPQQWMLEPGECGSRLGSSSQIRCDPLAERLTQIEPHANLPSRQIDDQFRMRQTCMVVTATGRLDAIKALADVKFLRAGEVGSGRRTQAKTGALTEQRARGLRRKRMQL